MRKGFYLLVILLFPSIIYMLFSLAQHNVARLEFYGQTAVSAEGDTIYQSVPNIRLHEAKGGDFALHDLAGKIIVLDIIDWPCDEACRKKGVTLANYLVDVEEKENWMVLSVCLNPNTPEEELADFASKHLAEGVEWKFVTADNPKELNTFLDYVFVETQTLQSRSELPSRHYVLLDRELRIRSFFDSRIHKEVKKLEDAIKLIIQEPFISWKEKKS